MVSDDVLYRRMSEAFSSIGVEVSASFIRIAARRAKVSLVDMMSDVDRARVVSDHIMSHATLSEKATF